MTTDAQKIADAAAIATALRAHAVKVFDLEQVGPGSVLAVWACRCGATGTQTFTTDHERQNVAIMHVAEAARDALWEPKP